MANKFFNNGELKDKKIVSALKRASKDYENGEIIEVRDLILEIAAAIYKWEAAEYGVESYCPLCSAKLDDEKIMLFGGQRGGGKIFFMEQLASSLREQLKATEVDRDRWKSAALYYRNLYIKQKQEENVMKQYIGTKVIQAEPTYRYRIGSGTLVFVSHDEDKPQIVKDATACEDGYKILYPDGYVSWSPKEVFEEAYRQTDAMNFGLAIEAMKKGERVARKGWNGKDMYVFLAYEADFVTDADISAFDQLEVEVGDMLVMKTAQNTFQPGWLASQADMLADDWYIVE